MVKTPKGIMHLVKKDNGLAYCYDGQTGNEYIFLLSEVSDYNPLYPMHEFTFTKDLIPQ